MPPRLDQDLQKYSWKLGDALAKALRAPSGTDQGDPRWTVTGLASKAWKIDHPELPPVKDEGGAKRETLLQLNVQQDEDSGRWFVIAQNKVVGPENQTTPRALIVAREESPPSSDWDTEAIAQAAANFFRAQKEELKKWAKSMSPTQTPGSETAPAPMPGSGGPPAGIGAASRKKIAAAILEPE